MTDSTSKDTTHAASNPAPRNPPQTPANPPVDGDADGKVKDGTTSEHSAPPASNL